MSRTGLYDLPFLFKFCCRFLVVKVYMLKSNIEYFCVTSFLCSLMFLLFHRIEYHKRCLWKCSMSQFVWYDCAFKKQCTVPMTLAFDLWKSICLWIEYNPISILYTFQSNISYNSRENKIPKYWQDTQTDRQGQNNTSQPPPGAR